MDVASVTNRLMLGNRLNRGEKAWAVLDLGSVSAHGLQGSSFVEDVAASVNQEQITHLPRRSQSLGQAARDVKMNSNRVELNRVMTSALQNRKAA